MHQRSGAGSGNVHLVGGGLASLAAAVLLIRDAEIPGERITIYEQTGHLGGGPDKTGSAAAGYTLRPGRDFESKYLCTYDLFSSIPTLDGRKTVTREIFERNHEMRNACKGLLIRDGRPVETLVSDLDEEHLLCLENLANGSESALGNRRIDQLFSTLFFRTTFWLVLQSTFCLQPWHSLAELRRLLLRFNPISPSFSRLHGSMRGLFRQHESLIRPLERWLRKQMVRFAFNTRVVDLAFARESEGIYSVEALYLDRTEGRQAVHLTPEDHVIITLSPSSQPAVFGSMNLAPVPHPQAEPTRSLWRRIAEGSQSFGSPAVFEPSTTESALVCFTITFHDLRLLYRVRELTGTNGGLVALADSTWTLSLIFPHLSRRDRRRFPTNIVWGYGLAIHAVGDHVQKTMLSCAGSEIVQEILGHLRIRKAADRLSAACTCIPCFMPAATSPLLPRAMDDRPKAVPNGSANLAFTGQFCDLPDEVTCTTEYSIRSAYTAVYALLGIGRVPSPVYKGRYNPALFTP